MKRFYILYRFFNEGGAWILYNSRRGGLTRKEMKDLVAEMKKDKDIEVKVLTESMLAILKQA